MVRPPAPVYVVPPAPAPNVYEAVHPALAQPSSAPLLSFFMYRVQNDEGYPPVNQNMANLPGALWYLHNEVIWHVPRRFGKTRIQKYKFQTRATQPLWDTGMNFGVRVAFDRGQCTGPFNCTEWWEKYGYYVGCNYVVDFPTAQWRQRCHYPLAAWYSIAGPCTSKTSDQTTPQCAVTEPGGQCPVGVTPTGAGDCTYNFEFMGEISLDELSGFRVDYRTFTARGGREYVQQLDRGFGTGFWNRISDERACQDRVAHADTLFKNKYPDQPSDAELPAPPCDCNYLKFYGGTLPSNTGSGWLYEQGMRGHDAGGRER